MKLACYYCGKARDLPGFLASLRSMVEGGGWVLQTDKRQGCIFYYNTALIIPAGKN